MKKRKTVALIVSFILLLGLAPVGSLASEAPAPPAESITAVAPLADEVANQSIQVNGTPNLPPTLSVTVAHTLADGTVESEDKDMDVSWQPGEGQTLSEVGTVTYTASLAQGSPGLAENVSLPTIEVSVTAQTPPEENSLSIITDFAQPQAISVPMGTQPEALNLPADISATVNEAQTPVAVLWSLQGDVPFSAEAEGTFSYEAKLPEDSAYTVQAGLAMPVLTVNVESAQEQSAMTFAAPQPRSGSGIFVTGVELIYGSYYPVSGGAVVNTPQADEPSSGGWVLWGSRSGATHLYLKDAVLYGGYDAVIDVNTSIEENVNIAPLGTNSITNTRTNGTKHAIRGGGFAFSGTGTLTATGGSQDTSLDPAAPGGNGLYASSFVNIFSGSVTFVGGASGSGTAFSSGIEAQTVTVSGGSLSGTGGNGEDVNGENATGGRCIYARESFEIFTNANATVTARGGNGESFGGHGLYAKTIKINDGTIVATGGAGGSLLQPETTGYGIFAGNALTILGGHTTATGGTGVNGGVGVWVDNEGLAASDHGMLTLNGGTLHASGGEGEFIGGNGVLLHVADLHMITGELVANGGSVHQAGIQSNGGAGVVVEGNIEVRDGILTTTGGEGTKLGGTGMMLLDGSFTQYGGTVTSTGKTTGFGLLDFNNDPDVHATLHGGVLHVSTGSGGEAIYMGDDDFILNGGTLIAAGKQAFDSKPVLSPAAGKHVLVMAGASASTASEVTNPAGTAYETQPYVALTMAAAVPIASAAATMLPSLTYNGLPQTQNVELALTIEGVRFVSSAFTISNNTATSAGSHTLTLTAQNNGVFSGTAFKEFTIAKAPLRIAEAVVANKYANGSTEATVAGIRFNGLVNGESLRLGTDYVATAQFENADIGTGKAVHGSVSLQNTALANNYTLIDNQLPTGTAASITTAETPDVNYDTTASLDIQNSRYPAGLTLHSEALSEVDALAKRTKFSNYAQDNHLSGNMVFLSDIYLSDANQNRVQPSGDTRIRINIPDVTPQDRVVVLHEKSDGSIEAIYPSVYNGYIEFTPSSFSVYSVLVEKNMGSSTTQLSPQTGVQRPL